MSLSVEIHLLSLSTFGDPEVNSPRGDPVRRLISFARQQAFRDFDDVPVF
jgi:hypothetical protein